MSTDSTQQIEEAASAWLIRRDAGRWSADDQARFDAWLRESTLHRVAYLRLELGWEEARRLKALGAGVVGNDPPLPGQWNLTPFFDAATNETSGPRAGAALLDRRVVALAAGVMLAIAAILQFWPAGRAYETPVGGISSVPIADGSKVTLNTDSQIRVALTEAERRIDLKQGEVFFEVAQDPKRPFVVHAGNRRIVAVGTQFSVRRSGDDIGVIVTEGRVRVENDEGAVAAPPGASVDPGKHLPMVSQEVLLTAGSFARATESGILVQAKSVTEAEEQLSWRTGVLMFRNQMLAEVAAEFNRYNTRKLVIDDAGVGALKIEGNFRATNVDAFARLLEEVYPVTVAHQDSGRLLIKPR